MKTLLASLLTMFFTTNNCYSQENIYRNGLNGNGSYYNNQKSTNYPNGVFVNGNLYSRMQVPNQQNSLSRGGFYGTYNNYNSIRRGYIYGPQNYYQWHDRLRWNR